jgi:hypothetical protein
MTTSSKVKQKAFWFHYNKPLSLQRKKNILTIHFDGACHFVEGLDCRVPIKTRNRKVQPRCVMAGKAVSIKVENETAVII